MTVAYSLADGVATIALDRPEVRNALNLEMCEALFAATTRAVADDARLVFVRGNAAVVQPASQMSGPPDPKRGIVALRQYGCATCHRIPGVVGADTPVGPPLAHIAGRSFLAGTVANTTEGLIRWLRSPQALHPGSAMPDLGVTERDARDMVDYLTTLQ